MFGTVYHLKERFICFLVGPLSAEPFMHTPSGPNCTKLCLHKWPPGKSKCGPRAALHGVHRSWTGRPARGPALSRVSSYSCRPSVALQQGACGSFLPDSY